MNLVERAYAELFPNRIEHRSMELMYSKAFNNYNANVKYTRDKIQFRLSYEWKEVDEDIVIGLMQMLFLKMYKEKGTTSNIGLYHSFIKKLSVYSSVESSDPVLEASFHRVNKKYFDGFMDRPNLLWGTDSARKLGHYEFASDTIVISTLFKEEEELLDYIVYHELLHKKLKFSTTNSRSLHHSTHFKEMEAQFENKHIEQDLNKFLRRQKMKGLFRFW